ncbi:hypothetical protein ACOSQ2_025125 [Xanthoceras sorbifolium]
MACNPGAFPLTTELDSSLGIHGNLARGKALPTLTVHYGRKCSASQASLIEEGRTHLRRCLSPNASDPISQAHYWKTKINMRRGQDSNLQSSGHGPDESTNSSSLLLPLLFLSLFPPRAQGLQSAASPIVVSSFLTNYHTIGRLS